ncbi:MAG: DNA repair exonuclease [Oligoflexia bacterium]|nr:DNA repair exonuclease [Oligoflexia bacterium]
MRKSTKSKSPLRLCHLADLHLGYRRYNRLTKAGFNQREADVNIALREAFDRLIKLRPAAVLIAGDVFHTVRPSNAVLGFAFRELKRLTAALPAPVIIAAGNHETPRRSDTGSPLRILAEVERVFIADQGPEQFTFEDLNLAVHCIPHAALSLDPLPAVRADDRFAYNVLMLHGQVGMRWISDFGGANINLRDFSQHEWDYIALGHVHLNTEVGLNAAYSGSIEHTALNIWSEGDTNKGFLEIQLPEGKRTFHALTSPRSVVVLKNIDGAGLSIEQIQNQMRERIESVPGGLEGKLVRLLVLNVPRELQRQLDLREIKKWRSEALNLSLELLPPLDHERTGGLSSGKRGNLEQELAAYCRDWKFSGEKGAAAEALIKSYFNLLEERDEAGKPQSA